MVPQNDLELKIKYQNGATKLDLHRYNKSLASILGSVRELKYFMRNQEFHFRWLKI